MNKSLLTLLFDTICLPCYLILFGVSYRIYHTRTLVAGGQYVHRTPARRRPQAAPHCGAQPCHGGRGGARAEGRAAPARRSGALREGHRAAQGVVATG
jgi:hypothetical protein